MAEDFEDVEVEENLDLSNSDVVTKYKLAAEIANQALVAVIGQCVPGRSIVEICAFGDNFIEQQCAGIYKSKKIEKGIAFPTCVSANEIVAHYSPLTSETTALKAGDWVKIDLGCHIDGFIALVAHTIFLSPEGTAITGPAADVLAAAHVVSEALQRVIRPGANNSDVTKTVARICEAYGVTACQGVLMHQLKRFVIDGNKVAIQKEEPDQKVEKVAFQQNEVYSVDIILSTGEGKPREAEARTTVFKRAVEENYRLKMKASRYVLNEVNKSHPTLPFTIRAMDERQSRMGVVECVNHGLLHPYPVLVERVGSLVVHLKFTVLLMPSGLSKITGLALPLAQLQSSKVPDEETVALLRTSTKAKKKKKAKKAAGAAAAGADVEMDG